MKQKKSNKAFREQKELNEFIKKKEQGIAPLRKLQRTKGD